MAVKGMRVISILLLAALLFGCPPPQPPPPVTAPEINVRQDTNPLPDGTGSFTFAATAADGADGIVSPTVTFTIENSGSASLSVVAALSSGDTGEFDVLTPPPATVAASGSATFTMQFDPITEGVKTATLEITNNDADENPYTFTVTGMGLANGPEIYLEQDSIELPDGSGSFGFGNVAADGNDGYASSDIDFTITNFGTQDLNLTGVTLASGDTGDFDIVALPASPVASTASSILTIRFDPLTSGAKSAVVQIDNNDPDENPYTFTVTGTGLTPAPEIGVFQGATELPDGTGTFAFSDTLADGNGGVNSGDYTFTIYNTGTANLTVSASLTSGDTTEFDLTGAPSSPIAPAGNSTFTLRFDPTTNGAKSAVLTITNNDSDENPYTFTVTGTGVSGALQGTVVDSVGGSPVASATVSLYGSSYSAVTDANGQFTMPAVYPGEYTLLVSKTGRAGSKLQPVAITNGAATTIEAVQPIYAFSSTGTTTPSINVTGIASGGTYSGSVSINISVSAGSYPVAANAMHNSIYLKIGNSGAVAYNAASATDTLNYSWPTASYAPGSLIVNIVAYDVNNNRSELNIPVTVAVTSGTPPASAPSTYRIQANTFGSSLGLFQKKYGGVLDLIAGTPSPLKPSSGTRLLSAPADSTIVVAILARRVTSPSTTGMKIYRATAQAGPYACIGETAYYEYNSSDGYYYYTYYDASTALNADTTYWYRLSYMNQYGEGPQMTEVQVRILPKYNLNLTAPANNSVVNTTTPTFQWSSGTISGATRMDEVAVKEVNGASYIVDSTVTNGTQLVCPTALQYNKQYEWNVYSYYLVVSGSVASVSYPNDGNFSNNGSFYFTVLP